MMASDLYQPLSVALDELKRRRAEGLEERVNAYFGNSPLHEALQDTPFAVYAPALVSPNIELMHVLNLAKRIPFETRYMEFGEDKFVHLNMTKRSLGHLTFVHGSAPKQGAITSSMRVVDFNITQGRPMNTIRTSNGENFVDFHHRLLSSYEPTADVVPHDFSDWFRQASQFDPAFPYLRFLGLFMAHGILLGNFTSEKYESSFTTNRVLPAFIKLMSIFGVPPLIVPIEPPGDDTDAFWCYYPEAVRSLI